MTSGFSSLTTVWKKNASVHSFFLHELKMSSWEAVKQSLARAGQSHVLRFLPELSEEERESFLQELLRLDLNRLKEHCQEAARAAASKSSYLDLEPVPKQFVGSVRKSDRKSLTEWEDEGVFQISKNRVGALLLAGGQGTRLGVQYPKGMYKVGLPSGKTLYQIQAERLRRLQELANSKHASKCTIPWYIMTSEFTLAPTEKFFEENDYFGLDPANVIMFEQRMIPAVSFDGKMILQGKGKLAMAPDGNGGLYQALLDNNILVDMKKRGVEYLHVYCVDNILVKMADPVFIGFCVSKKADCGAKVVEKSHPAEPVGVVCRVAGVPQVVEYSEIRADMAELRGPEGELVYSAGNICNHFFTRSFLQEVLENFLENLKHHVAIKKVTYVDVSGVEVKPSEANAIKMEKFVFDVFPFSRDFVVFEALREDEFSPLKNADGAATDSPTTARNALLTQHARWAAAAGATLLDHHGNHIPLTASGGPCEISPLISYGGEGLELLDGRTLTTPFILDEETAKKLRSESA